MTVISGILDFFSSLFGQGGECRFFNLVQVNQSGYYFVMSHDHDWKNRVRHYQLEDKEVFWLTVPRNNNSEENPKAVYSLKVQYLNAGITFEDWIQLLIKENIEICKDFSQEKTRDNRDIIATNGSNAKENLLSLNAFVPIKEEPGAFLKADYVAEYTNTREKSKRFNDFKTFLKSIKIIKKEPKHDKLSLDTEEKEYTKLLSEILH
jgi:hypothetical protein